jgi:hypothetical protein
MEFGSTERKHLENLVLAFRKKAVFNDMQGEEVLALGQSVLFLMAFMSKPEPPKEEVKNEPVKRVKQSKR